MYVSSLDLGDPGTPIKMGEVHYKFGFKFDFELTLSNQLLYKERNHKVIVSRIYSEIAYLYINTLCFNLQIYLYGFNLQCLQ